MKLADEVRVQRSQLPKRTFGKGEPNCDIRVLHRPGVVEGGIETEVSKLLDDRPDACSPRLLRWASRGGRLPGGTLQTRGAGRAPAPFQIPGGPEARDTPQGRGAF